MREVRGGEVGVASQKRRERRVRTPVGRGEGGRGGTVEDGDGGGAGRGGEAGAQVVGKLCPGEGGREGRKRGGVERLVEQALFA